MVLDSSTLGWLFGSLGGGLLLLALHLCRRPVRLLAAGGRARGTVVGSEETYGVAGRGNARKHYRPKVRFVGSDGQTLTFTSSVGHGTRLPDGAEVQVLYDPSSPGEAEVRHFSSIWLAPLICALFGVPLLLTGLSLLLPA